MEKEILKAGPVLDKKGCPIPGFSRKSTLIYDRKSIKAFPWRMKEWDFYQMSNDHLCLQMTIWHVGYAGEVSVKLFDFQKGKQLIQRSRLLALPFGSLHMPEDAERDHSLIYNKDGIFMSFEAAGDERMLTCSWQDTSASILLKRCNPDSLVINIPFDESPTNFYYNHKINCMTAEGYVRNGGEEWFFNKRDSFGLLDWGRGVWPFHNEWYWSNGAGYLNGEIFGFNLGCGFGNLNAASENMLFYQGKSHKIGNVDFIMGENYMDPWHLQDREGRLDLTLKPVYDRTTKTDILWVHNCCHQMFGSFEGYVILEDGMRLEVENVVSFAEHAVNNW